MAIAKPSLALAVEAGMNKREDYISRFVFTPTRAEDVARAPGSGAYTATAYRIDPLQNISLGEKSLQRGPLAKSERKSLGLQDFTVRAEEYSIEYVEDVGTVGSLKSSFGLANLESDTVAPWLTQQLLIDEEVRAAEVIKDSSGGFTVGANLTSSKWTDDANNPLSNLRAAWDSIKQRGETANAMLFSKSYWDAFVENAYIKEIFGDNVLTMTKQELEQALTNLISGHSSPTRIEIRVAGAVNDSANEGATDSIDYIYDDHALMFVRGSAPEGGYSDMRDLCAGKCYTLREPAVDYYEEDDIDAAIWRARHVASPEVFDANLAYYFSNAV